MIALLVLLFSAWPLGTEAVWLNVPAGETKCISEEIQADNIVLGEYSVVVIHDNGQLHHGLPIISAKVKVVRVINSSISVNLVNILICMYKHNYFWIESNEKFCLHIYLFSFL